MYWYKVKTILIVLFALINAFLIWITVSGSVQHRRAEQQLSESLVKALQNSLIGVSEDMIPAGAPKMKNALIENAVDDSTAFAEKMLGAPVTVQTDDEGKRYYAAELKSLYIENGSFRYYNPLTTANTVLNEGHAKKATELLSAMGIDLTRARPTVNGDTIVFTFYIGDSPLFVNDIKVKMSDRSICEAAGYIIRFSREAFPERPVRKAREVLVDFLQDSTRPQTATTIKGIELGFSILLGDTSVNFKTAEAFPTYRITTGGNRVYYYDASSK